MHSITHTSDQRGTNAGLGDRMPVKKVGETKQQFYDRLKPHSRPLQTNHHVCKFGPVTEAT